MMTQINLAGRLVDLSLPCVMTIVNATPDSFFQGSRASAPVEIVKRVEKAILQGAKFIDVGGYSTRPGAQEVSFEEEIERLSVAIRAIKSAFGTSSINLSVDTFRSSVVERLLELWGEAFVVNDIKAGLDDRRMLEIVGSNKLPYIAMHGGVAHLLKSSVQRSNDIVCEVLDFFVERRKTFLEHGINDLIFDVGFGFAKTVDQNFELLSRFDECSVLDTPQLVGISRKGMIWKTLGVTPEEALNGTTVLHTMLLERGANILRVHDTKQAMECVTIFNQIKR